MVLLNEVTFDMNRDNNIMLMPIVKNEEHFEKWISFYPFYQNVSQKGVALFFLGSYHTDARYPWRVCLDNLAAPNGISERCCKESCTVF